MMIAPRPARLLGLGRPVRVVLDAERLHRRGLLGPGGLLLLGPAPLGDLVPLSGRGIERLLWRLPLGQGLGDLERELALVLVGGGNNRVWHQIREARLDGVEILVGAWEQLAEL